MALVVWEPKGYSVPIELLAVKVPPGKITEREWWEALSDRVTELAMEASPKATMQVCRVLDSAVSDEAKEAGQYLLTGNLNRRTHLNLSVIYG